MNMNDMPLPSHLDAADPYRFTTVAHRAHRFGGPLSDAKAAVMVELLGLHARSQVLDLGCGKANLLAMVLQRWGCSGLGVDVNPHFVAEAKRAHFALVAGGRLKLLEQSGGAVLNKGGEFDAALCLGAAHYLGGLQRLLTDLRRCLNRGAVVLVGEGYWAKAPAPAFLDLIAGHEDQMGSHAENAQRARSAGYDVLYTTTASTDEWDEYEGLYAKNVLEFCHHHPQDADTPAWRARVERWQDGWLRWGRDTLGFGYYVLRLR
jgi:SAM-dependent methyltransferase